jgi:hypothetical protein
MKSVNLNIKSIEVNSIKRPIRTKWTVEMDNDIFQFSGIDTDYFERIIAKEFRRENRKKTINKIFKS